MSEEVKCLLAHKKDGPQETVVLHRCCSSDSGGGVFRKHKWLIYMLLTMSFVLHFYVLTDVHHMHKRLGESRVQSGVQSGQLESDSREPEVRKRRHHSGTIKKAWDDEKMYLDRDKRNANQDVSDRAQANVEFIHPKLRDHMPEENPEDPMVWLTSYSRVPLHAIEDFCSATKEYCPPGKEGPKGDAGDAGIPGSKGKRGKTGRPGSKGAQGHTGPVGPPGSRGPKGENGIPGLQGLDGRDGLPGEPGLDGVPGRNGLDGIPGVDGIPGTPGMPGTPGKDGRDGEKGIRGGRGVQGPQGERGLPGPRGRQGKDGENGNPGEPGVSLWTVKGSSIAQALIPPTIAGGPSLEGNAIIVKEGDHLKLTCAATGVPKPQTSWNLKNGNAIPDGAWRKSNVVGSTLNITQINRDHMGTYVCEATNGIPPVARQEFVVQVHFPPLIRIHRQVVGGYNGSFAILQCTVEAFPIAVNYWERHDGRLIQQRRGKYTISSTDFDVYKTDLYLNVSLSEQADFGTYYCISKNGKGLTKAAIELFERDPNSSLPPPVLGGSMPTVFGQEPPDFAGVEDLCPPKPTCPDCAKLHALRCEGSARMYGLNILPYDSAFPGLPNRTEECLLENIGKPVFHRYTGDLYGSWIQDAVDREAEDGNKLWVTRSGDNKTLYEYVNRTMFKEDVPTRNYTLPLSFTGNDHVVYNGSFFYLHLDSQSIVQFDLTTLYTRKLRIPRNRVVRNSGLPLLAKLYGPQQEDNYLDLNTDENGIWAIMGLAVDNNTVVMKFDAQTLQVQFMWNISLSHHQVADMFIVCGVLYAVDHVDERDTKIRFALDLYKNKLLDVELPFTNPFRFTTTLGYNPRLESLTTWDAGNQLTYPVKYHDIGYKEEVVEKEEEAKETGFQVHPKDDGMQILDLPQKEENVFN